MAKTIAEIAEATGYSRTTITLVLGGRASEYRISERAQNIINAYVAEHGYTINQTARNLKTKRSHTVGFIAPDIANSFFARVMSHLETLCRGEGLVLITTSSSEDPELEARALSSLLARGVDGLFLAPCTARKVETGRKRTKSTPLVLIDRLYAGDNVSFIASDHEENARLVTHGVLNAGADAITFLCGHPDNPTIRDRVAGFHTAAREAGLASEAFSLLSAPEDSVNAGEAMMATLLSDGAVLPPAILCSSLLVLEGALRFLKRSRGNVPPKLIVGTFDYDGFLELLPNPVLAIRQDEEAIARAAFACLKTQMENGKDVAPETRIIPAELMRLGDCGAV